jgi:hypothetical protein
MAIRGTGGLVVVVVGVVVYRSGSMGRREGMGACMGTFSDAVEPMSERDKDCMHVFKIIVGFGLVLIWTDAFAARLV